MIKIQEFILCAGNRTKELEDKINEFIKQNNINEKREHYKYNMAKTNGC